jgi:hypothetical protein
MGTFHSKSFSYGLRCGIRSSTKAAGPITITRPATGEVVVKTVRAIEEERSVAARVEKMSESERQQLLAQLTQGEEK